MYSKEVQMAVLHEMWVEASNEFCRTMQDKPIDFEKTQECRKAMEAASQLMNYIRQQSE